MFAVWLLRGCSNGHCSSAWLFRLNLCLALCAQFDWCAATIADIGNRQHRVNQKLYMFMPHRSLHLLHPAPR